MFFLLIVAVVLMALVAIRLLEILLPFAILVLLVMLIIGQFKVASTKAGWKVTWHLKG